MIIKFITSIFSAFIGFFAIELFLDYSSSINSGAINTLTEEQRDQRAHCYTYSCRYHRYPSQSTHELVHNEFRERYTVDKNGFLGYGTLPAYMQKPIITIGDSFTFGYGVNPKESVSAHIGAYNAGLWGRPFNSHNYAYQFIEPIIEHETVVWMIYPPHLISLTGRGWNSFYQINEQHYLNFVVQYWNKTEISQLFLRVTGFGINTHGYFDREFELYEQEHQPDVTLALKQFETHLESIVRHTEKASRKLFICLIPSKLSLMLRTGHKPWIPLRHTLKELDPENLDQKIISLIRNQPGDKVKVINMASSFLTHPDYKTLFFNEDAHWNADGHQFVAKILRHELALSE